MKKFVCMMLVLTLCLCAAMAAAVPSKTTGDMTRVENIQVQNKPASTTNTKPLVFKPVTVVTTPAVVMPTTTAVPGATGDSFKLVGAETAAPEATAAPVEAAETMAPEAVQAYQKKVEVCNTEIQKLAASTTIETYFGEVKSTIGTTIDLKATLNVKATEELKVHEFVPLVVENYEASYGNVTTTMSFSTSYAKNEPVVVLVGIVKVNADGTESIEWTAINALAAENGVEMEMTPELMLAIQNGTAMMTVVSKGEAEVENTSANGNNGNAFGNNGSKGNNGKGAEMRNENAEHRGANGSKK